MADKPEDFIGSSIKASKGMIDNILKTLAGKEESAEINLDGMKLRIGQFRLTLSGDVKVTVTT